MRSTHIRTLFLALIGTVAPLGLRAENIVVPAGFADQFGNQGREVSGFQQVIASSQFASASAEQILITGVAFRLDEKSIRSLDYVVPIVRIEMSTFPRPLREMTIATIDNFGPDRTRVLNRRDYPLFAPLGEGPGSFRIRFTFDQPFYYDLNAGHLLIDFVGSGPDDRSAGIDWHESLELKEKSMVTEPGPFVVPGGVIMEFSYSPVPEPRVSILFLVGLGALAYRRMR